VPPRCLLYLPSLLSSSLYSYASLRYLHSFPTRRSSDLEGVCIFDDKLGLVFANNPARRILAIDEIAVGGQSRQFRPEDIFRQKRSEEHTSELQSREKIVCRLLLEKKKKKW